MAYQNTTITSAEDFLDKLYTFATATAGWTGVFNLTTDISPNYRQIGIEKGNCHLVMGGRSTDAAIARTPSGTDTILSAALCTAIVNTNPNRTYFGAHTGTLVTGAGDTDRVRLNDMGELSSNNVWFFSGAGGDPDYIHAIVQCSAERYAHLGFGIIDALGMTHASCAFLCGTYFEWWPNGTQSNNPQDANHVIGHYVDQTLNGIQVYVPAGVLPGGYPASAVFNYTQITGVMTRTNAPSGHYSASSGFINDFFLAINNAAVTGGTVGYALPIFLQEASSGTSHVALGVIPGIRSVSIGNHTPAEILQYGSENWVIFPLKRKGARSEIVGGANPIATANSIEYALMYKKNP